MDQGAGGQCLGRCRKPCIGDVLRPFVYRRYLDYGVFSSLREMKALIEAEVAKKEFRGNLKLGPGGIREIEFIVQTLQLVRGGTVAALRERQLLKALPALVQARCLPEGGCRRNLRPPTASCAWRRIESRPCTTEQTHDLPGGTGGSAAPGPRHGLCGLDRHFWPPSRSTATALPGISSTSCFAGPAAPTMSGECTASSDDGTGRP